MNDPLIKKTTDPGVAPQAGTVPIVKTTDEDTGSAPADIGDGSVSINLRYYNHKTECFSDWGKSELKAFSALNDKLRSFTWREIQSSKGPDCHKHVNPKKVSGFSRPASVSEDIPFYNLKVTGKARVHGFHFNSVFYLVWLDKGHKYHA